MAESTYHRMSVQHIKYLDQHRSPGPVRLVHQPPQAPIGGGYGSSAPGYGAVPPANTFGSAGVTTGFGGKLAPPQPDFYPER